MRATFHRAWAGLDGDATPRRGQRDFKIENGKSARAARDFDLVGLAAVGRCERRVPASSAAPPRR